MFLLYCFEAIYNDNFKVNILKYALFINIFCEFIFLCFIILFSEIVRKRRNHEYSIQKRNKRILDYDSYISTEIALLKLTRFRRQVCFFDIYF